MSWMLLQATALHVCNLVICQVIFEAGACRARPASRVQVIKKSGFCHDVYQAHELDKNWDGFDKERVVCDSPRLMLQCVFCGFC